MTTLAPPHRIDLELAGQAWEIIDATQNIGIISHRHPDPDCLGSNLALYQTLTLLGKNVASLCLDPPPESCRETCQNHIFLNELPADLYDLLICLDCGSDSQVGFELTNLQPQVPVINIDHHTSNNYFGQINLVYPTASSASEIVYELLKIWQQPVTAAQATLLLMGIYFDTGSFMHSNINDQILNLAGQLVIAGADLPKIIKNLFHNFSEQKYHLWGKTLENIKLTPSGTAIAVLTPEPVNDPAAPNSDTSGLIDYVCMVRDCNLALLISQENDDLIRGSLRTRKDCINVFEIARTMGGGGHQKASGFCFPGKIQRQTIWKITN